MDIRVKKGMFQDLFLLSESKFPWLIGSVGIGKTLLMLTKIYSYCEKYPGTTGLIVRKEFTDLKDSTMKDFENYFQTKIGINKNYSMPCGSHIMFRHADEIQVLKNINLGIAGIEQGEEFEDDLQFQFIRDRLRQQNGAKVRPLIVIANANGHNWMWKLGINNAETIEEIDPRTGQYQYKNGEYDVITANTFANESNLPPDFIADLKRKEIEAPNHYKQYVLNSFEEMTEDDFVFSFGELLEAQKREYAPRDGFGQKVMGFDIARYGNDKCAAYGLIQVASLYWKEFHKEQWDHKDLDYSTGRILSIANSNKIDDSIIDEDGIGSGPLDTITKGRKREDFRGFRNCGYSYEDNKEYANQRTEAAFIVKSMINKGQIGGLSEEVIQELMTLRYKYTNDGRKILISKEEMRKKGVKSPNLADAMLMAVSIIDEVVIKQDNYYLNIRNRRPQTDNLFQIAGVR